MSDKPVPLETSKSALSLQGRFKYHHGTHALLVAEAAISWILWFEG